MVEAVGMARDERAAMWVAVVLLAGGFILFLLQLPAVNAGGHFSPWLYVPPTLSFFVALWKKADDVAVLSGLWLSLFFMIDVYYGISFFA